MFTFGGTVALDLSHGRDNSFDPALGSYLALEQFM
jgi:hypothetical protein